MLTITNQFENQEQQLESELLKTFQFNYDILRQRINQLQIECEVDPDDSDDSSTTRPDTWVPLNGDDDGNNDGVPA